VTGDGTVLEEGASPRTSRLSDWYPFTTGNSVGFAADTSHSITVMPNLQAEPLTKDYPGADEYVNLRGATRVPDGRIAVLVD
jgi:hypothetical protein